MLTEFLVRLAISVLLLIYFFYSGFFKLVSVRRFVLMVVVFFLLCLNVPDPIIDFSKSLSENSLSTEYPYYDIIALAFAFLSSYFFLHSNHLSILYILLNTFFLSVLWYVLFLTYAESMIVLYTILNIGL